MTAGCETAEILALARELLLTADRWAPTEPVLATELRREARRLTTEVLERARRCRGEE